MRSRRRAAPGFMACGLRSYFGAPTAPNSTASLAQHDVEGRLRQRISGGLEARAADRRFREGEARAVRVEGAQHLQGLRHDLRTDAVTRQDRDLHALKPSRSRIGTGTAAMRSPSQVVT